MAPTSPTHESDAPMRAEEEIERIPPFEEPLYTEINIPLPPLPRHYASPPPISTAQSKSNQQQQQQSPPLSPPPSRPRAHSLSLSSFRSRNSSPSTSRKSEEWPRVRREIVKSREVAAAMNLNHAGKRTRSGTVDALAVVPAVLVLSAELFTPGSGERSGGKGRRKDSGVGKWEDGIR